MKPVMQTVTGPTGNCMGACLASILEVPIEAVPNFFDAGPDDTDWWNALRVWLRKFGLSIITLTFTEAAQWRWLRLSGYHIVSGPSPRLEGMHHATVWHDGAMVHDPHPDGTGIVKPETLDMLYLLDPSRLQLPASVIAAELRSSGVGACDMGPLCIGCTPRNPDGSCPGAGPEVSSDADLFVGQQCCDGFVKKGQRCKRCGEVAAAGVAPARSVLDQCATCDDTGTANLGAGPQPCPICKPATSGVGTPDDAPLSDRDRALIERGWAKYSGAIPPCDKAPAGWRCTRGAGHQGPCAAEQAKGKP